MIHFKWVVVVEKSGAEIFQELPSGEGLLPVRSFAHPKGRDLDRAFKSDRPGRSYNRPGARRHAFGPHVGPSEQDQHEFLTRLAKYLERNRVAAYASLTLVAAPRVLGMLRKILPLSVRRCVTGEIAKDYPSWMTGASRLRHLGEDLAAARS